jgi:hypothetical protein
MPTRNADQSVARRAAVAITREWADVHVEYVDLSVRPADSGPPRARVQACVELGGRLLPADVRVELVTTAGHGVSPLRLWSTRSYHNGSYLFEVEAPADRLASAGDLRVHVVPSGGAEADVEPVIAELAWPDGPSGAN